MTRLLQQAETFLALLGGLGSVPLSVVLAATEPTKNRSALALAITGGFGVLALLLVVCAVQHARHIGQLRWVWPLLILSLALWYLPAVSSAMLYNASAGILIYSYAGILGLASVAVGILREILPRAIAQP